MRRREKSSLQKNSDRYCPLQEVELNSLLLVCDWTQRLTFKE